MNELQNRVLSVGKEFKRVCDENNLRYFMSCGTLLGAVRHKGFIPWDDDMDFYMPRSDYLKLIELDKDGVFKKNSFSNIGIKQKIIFGILEN